jgi:hypothetical protein
MVLHDWTRVDAGTFHGFHTAWTSGEKMNHRMRNTLLSTASIAAWSIIFLALATGARALQGGLFEDQPTGDSAKPDDEGFIRDWLILAPIPFKEGEQGEQALDRQQLADEARLRPQQGQHVRVGGRELTWKKHHADGNAIDINKFLGRETENSVGYAACYVVAPREMKDLVLKTGSDDQSKVYLNGREVSKCGEARELEPDNDSTENITLAKGVNVIVFKIVNESEDWAGCLRFTDRAGKPVTDLLVHLKP